VVDVRRIVPETFDAMDFVLYCARQGTVQLAGKRRTLLVAPMSGFYNLPAEENPGRYQMRIAYVESPERMKWVPELFAALLQDYLKRSESKKPAAAVRG
jgi:aspartate aminotransferase